MRELFKITKFYAIKLPLILLTIFLGFIFEFIVTFPFLVFCTLDGIAITTKKGGHQAGDD